MIRIGTSGWHYDHWIGRFYPNSARGGDLLRIYNQTFNTVEINNTFYQLPSEQTFTQWRYQTSGNFLFSCKASRYITHMKKLNDPRQSTRKFLAAVAALADKLGPILFQLPPNWRVNHVRLQAFVATLPRTHRFAFEFRHQSWFSAGIFEILNRFGCAVCIYDLAGRSSPIAVTADLVYVRLHGPDGPYRGSYDDQALAAWADRLIGWSDEGRQVYCYFDNDDRGFAPADAARLLAMIPPGR